MRTREMKPGVRVKIATSPRRKTEELHWNDRMDEFKGRIDTIESVSELHPNYCTLQGNDWFWRCDWLIKLGVDTRKT